MNTADIISLLALIVAVLTGLVNYLYTKRTFEVSSFPAIQAWFAENWLNVGDPRIVPKIVVKNLSSTTPVTNVEISLYIANPLKKRRFWKRKWIMYRAKSRIETIDVIEPSSERRGMLNSQYFTDFVSNHYPNIIIKNERWDLMKFRLFSSQPLEVLLRVEYIPGVANASLRKISRYYQFVPRSGSDKILWDWHINPSHQDENA